MSRTASVPAPARTKVVVSWEGEALRLAGFARDTVDLRGRGLVLVPTAFGWSTLGIGR